MYLVEGIRLIPHEFNSKTCLKSRFPFFCNALKMTSHEILNSSIGATQLDVKQPPFLNQPVTLPPRIQFPIHLLKFSVRFTQTRIELLKSVID